MVDEFARLVLPLGTTAVVADPHEIANVLGVDGVHWLLDATSGLQLDVYFMAPSCVPGLAVRVASPRAYAGRPRVADAPPPRARPRRDDELPGRHRGLRGRAREARARGLAPCGRTCTGCPRAPPAGICGGRHLLGSRGPHGRGGSRTPASRDVAPRARGVDGAEPARSAAARRGVRAVAHRLLHGRPRPGGHRRRGPRQRHGSRGGRVRHLAGGRGPHGLAPSSRSGTGSVVTARSRPATSPTCCCSPIW